MRMPGMRTTAHRHQDPECVTGWTGVIGDRVEATRLYCKRTTTPLPESDISSTAFPAPLIESDGPGLARDAPGPGACVPNPGRPEPRVQEAPLRSHDASTSRSPGFRPARADEAPAG